MGLTTGDFPPVDPATFIETPYIRHAAPQLMGAE
jgi:hypothetical protein